MFIVLGVALAFRLWISVLSAFKDLDNVMEAMRRMERLARESRDEEVRHCLLGVDLAARTNYGLESGADVDNASAPFAEVQSRARVPVP